MESAELEHRRLGGAEGGISSGKGVAISHAAAGVRRSWADLAHGRVSAASLKRS